MTFPRVKPIGWALYETLTSVQMTQLDIDHAKATDSTYVKDYGAALWFPTKAPAASWVNDQALIYVPPLNYWAGVDAAGACFTAGGVRVTTASVFSAGLLQVSSEAIAFDGGNVVIAGGSTSISGSGKIRRALVSQALASWSTTLAATATTTQTCECLGWFAAAGLFIAGYSDGKVETSPDGISWTGRTTPDSFQRQAVAFSPTTAVMVNYDGAGLTKLLSSTDGITWTQRTIPISPASGWKGVSYSPIDGVFMIISEEGLLAKSTDGITWSAIAATFSKALYPAAGSFAAAQTVFTLKSLSNLWVSCLLGTPGGMMCSTDVGATWKLLLDMPTVRCIGVSGGQVAAANTVPDLYLSNLLSL